MPTRVSFEGLKGRGSQVLCGGMAAFCALMTIVLAVSILLVPLSFALPTGKANWLAFNFANERHQEAGWVWTKNCKSQGGHETCIERTRPLQPGDVKPDPINGLLAGLAFAGRILPLVVLAFGLSQASACFLDLMHQRYFDRSTVQKLRNFALCGLIFVTGYPNGLVFANLTRSLIDGAINRAHPGSLVYHGVSGVTFNLQPGGDFSSPLIIIYALTLTIIGGVMARAAAVAEDHAQIV